MFKMPASNYTDWRKWAQELLQQCCNSSDRGGNSKTVYVTTKDGGQRKTILCYVEEDRYTRDDQEYDRNYGYGDRYYDGYE